jgi:hypothetical protein
MDDYRQTLSSPNYKQVYAGLPGPPGSDGAGVPAGGTTNQVLAKASNADNDTDWVDVASLALDVAFADIGGAAADNASLVAYVAAAVAALVASAPGALNTLDELAAALGDDANFAATVTAALAGKQAASANLTTFAAIAPSANVQSMLGASNYAAIRTLLGLAIGSDVQAFNSMLAGLAALSDPNADRIAFWDDSAGALAWLDLSANLEISGTTLKPKYRGAVAKKSADQTGLNLTTATALTWDAEDLDTDSIHSTVSNTSRLTVPAGVSKIKLKASVFFGGVATDQWMLVYFGKNGINAFFGGAVQSLYNGSTNFLTTPGASIESATLQVTPGDYFEVIVQTRSDTAIDIKSSISFFEMVIIE